MIWVHPLSAETEEPASVLGGKASGLIALRRLGLPVPPGFVISTGACRAFLRDGRFPDGLEAELATAVAELEAATDRRLGGPDRPLVVSVRSGGSVSMPGMMDTVLNLGLTAEAAAGLAAETGDPEFARDARRRFLAGFAAAVRGVVFDDAMRQLKLAVEAVFASWDTPRARTYRDLHGIPHDRGTAVTVQAMVYGNRDDHSGSGVAFSRDPNTGENVPYGDVLFGRQGDDVVSGTSMTRPLHELSGREPAVWAGLVDALRRVEQHYRDACHVEFTFEAGELWILQVRPGGLAGRAAVRVAVDLADAGVIDRREALLRVSPQHLQSARTPRIDTAVDTADVLTRGLGACPGVAAGRVATTADAAVRMAADGPVILVRPQTSPLDMHGLAAAAGVVTALGGPTSHAAVVARAMGKPAVVGAAGLTIDAAAIRAGGRTIPEGTLITIDGTGGEVVAGSPRIVSAATGPHLSRLLAWADEVAGGDTGGDTGRDTGRDEMERLMAARAVIGLPPRT
ncbi:pyruvate, phosphate dikinase [Nonomuraea turkmeniaca]|uniref:Pyruvate, phosphate dikinase n=1 Tax=Nonomuraea turkmeniaca TaxID=103838 RepID=A0A5S4G1Y1_9ACTN|nr:pyruvate, phosphate dikinase [Nonomuraea turkmeniaca]TMR19232.1 pyruvate, phosphate dikinase [Nonomuraea turkmeniaca]